MRIFLSLCLQFLAHHGALAPARAVVPLGQDFSLHLGQEATIEKTGFFVAFVAVLEDSRCPVDTTCIWAGNAKVELQIREWGKDGVTVVLNTDVEPKATSIGAYALRLIALAPAPDLDTRIPMTEYAATLRVSAAQEVPLPMASRFSCGTAPGH